MIKKISYECRAYESVDVRSLFWVISHRSAESSTPGLKGIEYFLLFIINFLIILREYIKILTFEQIEEVKLCF